jgi:flavin-dependent dehydrogenase
MEVAIVGAGPAGCFLAKNLSGADVRLFEEHKNVGEPAQCAGLVSRNLENIVPVPKNCILNRVKGARFFSPDGSVVELSRPEDQAYVIDRAKFDQGLAKGLDIEYGKRVNEIDFGSRFVVGADGPNSVVAEKAGFPRMGETLFGVQHEIENQNHSKDFVELYFGSRVAPGFFAWVIPTDKNLRVGLAANSGAIEWLDRFVERKFGNVEILKTSAGMIPLRPRKSIVSGNVALVGDAAGQVKPTTGGGLYVGLRSAKMLADAISAGDLGLYRKNWNSTIKKELSVSLQYRKLMKNTPDHEINKVWKILNRPKVKKLLEEKGDMDNLVFLTKSLLKDPAVLLFVPYLRHLLKR